jgi:hypothetical protein
MNMSAKKSPKRTPDRAAILLLVEGTKKHGMTKMAEEKPKLYWYLLGQVLAANFTKFLLITIMKLKFHLRFSQLGVRDE